MELPEIKTDAEARLASQAAPTISKRAVDDRIYTIDCRALLREHELAIGAACVGDFGVQVQSARTRFGRYLELRVSGGEPAGTQHKDYPVTAVVQTSQGQFGVVLNFRVHL